MPWEAGAASPTPHMRTLRKPRTRAASCTHIHPLPTGHTQGPEREARHCAETLFPHQEGERRTSLSSQPGGHGRPPTLSLHLAGALCS